MAHRSAPRRVRLLTSALLGICLVVAYVARAAACATCTCGDPTLTTMGAQQPFAGRLRVSLDARHRTDAVGRPAVNRVALVEQRLGLGVAYAPVSWLMLSASAPFLHREVTKVDGSIQRLSAIGDAEARARLLVFRDRDFAPRHMLSSIAGMRFPTAPLERGPSGGYLEPELQPGTGSFDPIVGLSYALFADPWSAYVSEVVIVPTDGRGDFRMGASWQGAHVLQYQLSSVWALRAGVLTRLDERASRKGPDRIEPDTGGFVAYAAPAIVVSPLVDLVVSLELSWPVINALVGQHDEGPVVTLGVAYDI